MATKNRPGFHGRRGALRTLAFAPLALTGAGVGRAQSVDLDKLVAAAKAEGTVAVNSIFATTVEAELMKRFGDRYGIKVQYSRVGGTGPTLQKIYAEARAKQRLTDVVMLEKSGNIILKNDGMLEKFSIPADRLTIPQFRTDDDLIHDTLVSLQCIVYNRNTVKADELPRTWRDLSHPRYKGRLVIGTPENSGTQLVMIKAFTKLFGWDWIREFAKNAPLQVTREVEAADMIGRNERHFGAISQVSPAAQVKAGAPLGFHFPDNPVASEFAASIIANAPHPNAARLFVNHWLSEENQNALRSEIGAYSVLPSVAPPLGFPPLSSVNPYTVNYAEVVAERDKLIADWRAILG